jgi:hypothetical protein
VAAPRNQIPPLCPKHDTEMTWNAGRWVCLEDDQPGNLLEGRICGRTAEQHKEPKRKPMLSKVWEDGIGNML